MNTIFKTTTSFYTLTPRRKWLVLLAASLSLYGWLAMRFFKQYARFEGVNRQSKVTDKQLIADIRWAIFVVNKSVWWPNVCRHQAYQAKLLCRFYDVRYQIFVGFKKNEDGKIDGHAWAMAGGEIITGFCDPQQYTIQNIYEG